MGKGMVCGIRQVEHTESVTARLWVFNRHATCRNDERVGQRTDCQYDCVRRVVLRGGGQIQQYGIPIDRGSIAIRRLGPRRAASPQRGAVPEGWRCVAKGLCAGKVGQFRNTESGRAAMTVQEPPCFAEE